MRLADASSMVEKLVIIEIKNQEQALKLEIWRPQNAYLTAPLSSENIPLSLIRSPRQVNPSLGEYLSFSYSSTVSLTEAGSGIGSLIGSKTGGG
jgi:hypothetical protein